MMTAYPKFTHLTRRGVVRAAAASAFAAAVPTCGVAMVTPGVMKARRATHVTIRSGRHILVIGGFATEGAGLSLVERYEPQTGQFAPFANLTVPRIQPIAHALPDGRVLVVGGEWRAGVSTAEIWEGDRAFAALGPTRDRRTAAASEVLADGRVLLCGGSDARGDMIRTAEIFDPSTNLFERLPNMRSARAGHTATRVQGDKVLIVGGGTENGALADVELFDPASNSFVAGPPLRQARFKHGAAVLPGGDVLIVGGSSARGGPDRDRLSICERLDVKRQVFVPGPALVDARYKLLPSTIALDDGTIVIASGGSRPEALRNGARNFELLPVTYDTRRDYMAAVQIDNRRVLITGGYDAQINATALAWIAEV